MFIRLRGEQVQRYGKNALAWNCRGERYAVNEDQMLPNLVKLFLKQYKGYQVAQIRDNQRPANDPERIVLKYCNGVIEQNRLIDYNYMFKNTILPGWIMIEKLSYR